MKTRILSTEEIFRVTYNDGYFERLMRQTYNDSEPFYYRTKGENQTMVETSSSDLKEIESFLKRCLKIDKGAMNAEWNQTPAVKEVYKHCLDKQKEFLNKLKAFMDASVATEQELKMFA